MKLAEIYRPSLSLLTDLYQVTMAYGYWKSGKANQEAVFHLFFRKNPFQGGYTVAAGINTALDFLEAFDFSCEDIDYLGTLLGNDGKRLFAQGFLEFLGSLKLELDIEAVPEGTILFPHEPVLRVKGPMLQAQLVETALLNIINFQTLIATKATRVVRAAAGEPVLEFGLRRAQGIDGALAASRAAYIGGVAATSNLLAGRLFGIPVKGTHAHSWVMSFDSELESFERYAEAMPNNCVFLVDTFDTVEGVKKAIAVGEKLRRQGFELAGIRLDSGDLAFLSKQARALLDEAGFETAAIVASNDLDEHLIENLKMQDAKVGVWGVGTRLATAFDQPALGGVYKLGAIKKEDGEWEPKIKLSEQLAKVSNPGILQVRRYRDSLGNRADMIFDLSEELPGECTIVDPLDPSRNRTHDNHSEFVDLLEPMMRSGERLVDAPSLLQIRNRVVSEMNRFHETILRLQNPHNYPVGLELGLHKRKSELVAELRANSKSN